NAGGGSTDLENNMAEILNESSEQTTPNDSTIIPESNPIPQSDENLLQTSIKDDISNINICESII
ncbi:unnamed protein product, partial [Adineta steineri]